MKKLTIIILVVLLASNVFAQQIDVNLLKAKVLIEQKNYDKAYPLLKNLLATHKKDAWIYAEIGTVLRINNDYKGAIAYYLKADSIQKNYSSFYLAQTYALMGETINALAWLEKHLTGNAKKTELEITINPTFSNISQTPEWKKFWIKSWYNESETEINAITALLAKGKTNEAESELEAYQAKISPKHTYYYLQAQLLNLQNLPEQAIISIDQAIEKHNLSPEYLLLRAQLFVKTGKYQDALTDISKAIKINSATPLYYKVRAEIARLAQQLDIAEKDLAICNEIYPGAEETDHEMALLEKAKGNYLNALVYYDKLLEKNTSNANFFLERGNIALKVNQVEKADMDFGMALDINPNIAEAYLQKGNTRKILLDNLGACYSWNKAKQLGNSEAAKLIHQHCRE